MVTCNECGVTNAAVVLHDGGHEGMHPGDVDNVALCPPCENQLRGQDVCFCIEGDCDHPYHGTLALSYCTGCVPCPGSTCSCDCHFFPKGASR